MFYMNTIEQMFLLVEPNTNDSGLSCHLAWQGFHEIWMPDTWQGNSLPNRSDLGEGVGHGNGLPKTRSTKVKGRVGGGIFRNGM